MRGFFCKYHNIFLSIEYIENTKNSRCWNCRYFLRISNKTNANKKWR